MSFAAIRNTAYSSLMTTQVKMQVASSNIANADTAGYTRKIAQQSLTAVDGLGTGVAITGITSSVNKFLLKDLAQAATALGSASTAASYAMDLQSLFGTIASGDASGTSLANALSTLESAIGKLTLTPESDTLKTMVVGALEAVAVQLRETSSSIQTLRSNADSEIATSVDIVNTELHTIDRLNQQIIQATALGQPVGDLEDLRNIALQTISGQMEVQYHVNNFGEMRINTGSGTPMLDSAVHELSYLPLPIVTAGSVFDSIEIAGKSISGDITGGKIGGLIAMRDDTLASVQSELDALATNLIGTLNSEYNKASSMPAPAVLTGSKTVAATDALAGTGTMRVAVLDAAGKVVESLDIDLTTTPTVGDLAAAINALGSGTASVVNGKLVLTATNSAHGIAVTDLDSEIDTQGISGYFGLNDLMTGTSAANINVRADLLATPSQFSTATLTKAAAPLAVGSTGLSISADFLQGLADAFKSPQAFAAAGTLGATSTSLADYAASIVAHAATTSSTLQQAFKTRQTGYEMLANAMASAVGVNLDEETGKLAELKQQYSTAAQIFEALNAMFESLLQAARSA